MHTHPGQALTAHELRSTIVAAEHKNRLADFTLARVPLSSELI